MAQTQGISTPPETQISDLNNPEPNDSLSSSLMQPGFPPPPFPSGPQPTVTGPSPAPAAAGGGAGGVFGHVLGKVVGGLSGGHNEYTIDPSSGKMVPTFVKDSPGQTFRSILALGLMGGQGIGPKEGQYNFAQGLMAGLGGGARISQERKDQLDQQRRAQAQQDYANQLRAKQEEREEKKLTMEQELNRATIAAHNQEIAYRKIMSDAEVYRLNKEKGQDLATGQIQHSQMLTEADAPKVAGYKSLNIDPVAASLTADEVQKYLKDNPGASTKEMALHTGTKNVIHPDGSISVEDLYSIYPAMIKVPPSLLQEMRVDGADKPGSTLNTRYKDLVAAGDGTISAGKLLATYRDMSNWENLQESSLNRRVKESEIVRNMMEKSEASVRLRMAQLGLKEKEDQMAAENLFRHYYDVSVNNLNPNWKTDLQAGQPDPFTHKGKLTPDQAKRYQDLLQMAVTGNYETTNKDFYDHYKPTKDAMGNYIVDDAQAAPLVGFMNGLRNAQQQLSGAPAPTAQTQTAPASPLTPIAQKNAQGLPQGIPTAVYSKLISTSPTAEAALNTLDQLSGVSQEDKVAIAGSLAKYYAEADVVIRQQQQSRQQQTNQITDAADRAVQQQKLAQSPTAFTPPIVP